MLRAKLIEWQGDWSKCRNIRVDGTDRELWNLPVKWFSVTRIGTESRAHFNRLIELDERYYALSELQAAVAYLKAKKAKLAPEIETEIKRLLALEERYRRAEKERREQMLAQRRRKEYEQTKSVLTTWYFKYMNAVFVERLDDELMAEYLYGLQNLPTSEECVRIIKKLETQISDMEEKYEYLRETV